MFTQRLDQHLLLADHGINLYGELLAGSMYDEYR
jgi:hypothetical protein